MGAVRPPSRCPCCVARGRGVAQGDRVAQYLFNCPEYLEVSFAAYKAGLTPVNTNYRHKSAERVYLWSNADAVAVVFHGSFAPTIEPILGDVPTVRRWLWLDHGHGECPEWAEPYEAVASDPAAPGRYRAPWGGSSAWNERYMSSWRHTTPFGRPVVPPV